METTISVGMLAAGMALMMAPAAAQAGLELCNGTDARQFVAIGYKAGDAWVSEGWWTLDPGACALPVQGDLTSRYYYFRAEATGHDFLDEGYAFCTQRNAFTIEGDQNCAARGFDEQMFRQIDTGDALHFTYSFGPSVSPVSGAAPEPEPRGEPFSSDTAVFQACVIGGGMPQCSFHDGDIKFYVYEDGRTPEAVIRALHSYAPGTPIEVSGELGEIYDTSGEAVLQQVRRRPYNGWDSTLSMMQGSWTDPYDTEAQFDISGSEMETYYQGKFLGREYLSTSTSCEGMEGYNFLVRTEEETGDVYCFIFEELTEQRFVLTYLPRGNSHYFQRLD